MAWLKLIMNFIIWPMDSLLITGGIRTFWSKLWVIKNKIPRKFISETIVLEGIHMVEDNSISTRPRTRYYNTKTSYLFPCLLQDSLMNKRALRSIELCIIINRCRCIRESSRSIFLWRTGNIQKVKEKTGKTKHNGP